MDGVSCTVSAVGGVSCTTVTSEGVSVLWTHGSGGLGVPPNGVAGDGKNIAMVMQVAKRYVGSVRKMTEAGNNIVFDDDGRYIVNNKGGVPAQLIFLLMA